VVPLSKAARAVIDSVPVIDAGRRGKDYVFSLNGKSPINGRSKGKEQLDRLMLAALREQAAAAGGNPHTVELQPWELRDLRRTARTLMARAGVSEDLAERCLGHVMGGVRGVYNRYDFIREKRMAFDKLATLVGRIVEPPAGDNVVAMAAVAAGQGTRRRR
jgi:integrase